jgi:hypothetical protein
MPHASPLGRGRRLVIPPGPNDPRVPNRIISVYVRPNERVRWFWSESPEHYVYVSGYTLVPTWRHAKSGRLRPDIASQHPPRASD